MNYGELGLTGFERLPGENINNVPVFQAQVPVADFAAEGLLGYVERGINWSGFLTHLTDTRRLINISSDLEDVGFGYNSYVSKIRFTYPGEEDLELAYGLTDNFISALVMIWDGINQPQSLRGFPGSYLLEKYLRKKGASLKVLIEKEKVFVKLREPRIFLGKTYYWDSVGTFFWRGEKEELRMLLTKETDLADLKFDSSFLSPDLILHLDFVS